MQKESFENKIKFPLLGPEDIEVKVKQVLKTGAIALLYKTARTDRKYLNMVYGPMNWTSDYKTIKDNLYCGIGVREDADHQFVWKWDCGIESRTDDDGNEKKGEASDAFKRAGYQWSIGEELYSAPQIILEVATKEDGKKYVLENKYAKYIVTAIEYDDNRAISYIEIQNEKTGVVVFEWSSKNRALGKSSPRKREEMATKKTITPKAAEAHVEEVEEETKADADAEANAVKTPLIALVNGIGQKLKAMKTAEGNINKYNAIVLDVTGANTFRCNTATEEQYDIVLQIYNQLVALGY